MTTRTGRILVGAAHGAIAAAAGTTALTRPAVGEPDDLGVSRRHQDRDNAPS
jgi:hypothetical protein